MKKLFGVILFYFLIFKPVKASIIASFAIHSGLDEKAQITLLENASVSDPCNTEILNKIGDYWALNREFTMAAIAYGRSIACSPASAPVRFKYGIAVVLMGFPEHIEEIENSIKLEPNNPFYKAELERIKALQSQSP